MKIIDFKKIDHSFFRYVFVGNNEDINSFIEANNIPKEEVYKKYTTEDINKLIKDNDYFMRGCGMGNTDICIINQPQNTLYYINKCVNNIFSMDDLGYPRLHDIKFNNLSLVNDNELELCPCALPDYLSNLINNFNGADSIDNLDPEILLDAFYYFKDAVVKFDCTATQYDNEEPCTQILWIMWDDWFNCRVYDKQCLVKYKHYFLDLVNYYLKKGVDNIDEHDNI